MWTRALNRPHPRRGHCIRTLAIREGTSTRGGASTGSVVAERMVLVRPRLAERLSAVAQEHPHLDRLRAVDRQIELRAPVTGHVVGHGLGVDIGERAARRPQYRFGRDAEWQ